MNHYLSIVLGPLYKTILQARSTREIWAASYLFSILMREILDAAQAQGLTNLLSPEKLPSSAHRFGAGIYPDKAFWLLNDKDDYNKLATIKNQALNALEAKTGIKAFILEKAIRLYGVLYSAAATEPMPAMVELNKRIDILELQEKISVQSPEILWDDIIGNIQKLYDDGHPADESGIFIEYNCLGANMRRLPSIIEIATRDLRYISNEQLPPAVYDDLVTLPISNDVCKLIEIGANRRSYNEKEEKTQDNIVKELKSAYNTAFRFRHKYVAFILADGDNMGAALKAIGNNPANISAFSKELSAFTLSATKLIVQYGGIPIYAGGDDLLFALPLANTNRETLPTAGQNLFELILKIDAAFPLSTFNSLTNNTVTPSMSYGISVGYYKHPMDSLLDDCHTALYKAKDMAGKHAVAFLVKKHSGQLFSGCLPIGLAYSGFLNMLKEFRNFNDDAFLASVMFKLAPLEKLVVDALLHESTKFFFENQFNEKAHQSKFNDYLKASRELMANVFEECKAVFLRKLETENATLELNFKAGGFTEPEINNLKQDGVLNNASFAASHYAARQLYGCMRFIQFINQKDHE